MTEKPREYKMGYGIGKLKSERKITVKEERDMVFEASQIIIQNKLSWAIFCTGRLDGENSKGNE